MDRRLKALLAEVRHQLAAEAQQRSVGGIGFMACIGRFGKAEAEIGGLYAMALDRLTLQDT